ncbi:HNH endonuclease family protein [Nocardia sp. NBC_01327]|uniref:HNH endonuclease family protein n=1 Tax=Nocardia sp. NBC_01327 TaxID=2903593 RepID=UPI002E11875A|nr:HNH endonuclease family protein [Nocardia sp. NBC_01327]
MKVFVAIGLCALIIPGLAGCKASTPAKAPMAPAAAQPSGSQPAIAPPAGVSAAQARTQLAALPVKGRAAMTGYTRDQFGPAWTDNNNDPGGHNGCDTRDDILRRDLTDVSPASGCTIQSGTLHDVYTGKTIAFQRGPKSSVVQIDHMVPLGDAWQTGAQQLTAERRQDLANDPLNLQAVDGPTNEAKGDGDAATWLPPNNAYRCVYVERQIAVKTAYGLWITSGEHDAMDKLLAGCN